MPGLQAGRILLLFRLLWFTRPEAIGKKIGYTEEEMQSVPSGSNLGLGCGNPMALGIHKGRRDRPGSGFRCWLRLLPGLQEGRPKGQGHRRGYDPEMVGRARANALKAGYKNVEFRLGEIEKLPVDDGTIDVIISNCVINLVPDKEGPSGGLQGPQTWGQADGLDMVLQKELPDFVPQSI